MSHESAVSLPVPIPLAALPPPVDPKDQKQRQGQRNDVPDCQEQPEDNQFIYFIDIQQLTEKFISMYMQFLTICERVKKSEYYLNYSTILVYL